VLPNATYRADQVFHASHTEELRRARFKSPSNDQHRPHPTNAPSSPLFKMRSSCVRLTAELIPMSQKASYPLVPRPGAVRPLSPPPLAFFLSPCFPPLPSYSSLLLLTRPSYRCCVCVCREPVGSSSKPLTRTGSTQRGKGSSTTSTPTPSPPRA
jgi:hypothetical protein